MPGIKKYSFIDPGIRTLVATLNAYGLRTYASCQGHGFPVDRIKPYIAFTSTPSEAASFARSLRHDAESVRPTLNWGWEITAGFDSDFRLCFRLHPAGPHRCKSRFCRRSFTADFGRIRLLIKSAQASSGD
ncbi:hypothetical protein [Enterobacter sp. 638]|uniref:hypothetical protein n=1 Tax=Enterobacter sp. (strain 638) TaxID=399742 RepID=UPI0008FF82A6|nr:hypothetical protein [Enterobacter sp. 638]